MMKVAPPLVPTIKLIPASHSADILPFAPIRAIDHATPRITTTRRDTFWRELNAELERGGLPPATNGEMSAQFEAGALPFDAAAHIAVARIRKEQDKMNDAQDDTHVRLVFSGGDDFAAFNATTAYLGSIGFSVGRMQGHDPIGIRYGEWDIQKWRNLSADHRAVLDGTLNGDKRNGPIVVYLRPPAALIGVLRAKADELRNARVDWVTHAPEIAKARAILAGNE